MTRRLGVGTSGGASSVSVHSEAWFIRAQRAAGGNIGGEIVEQRTSFSSPRGHADGGRGRRLVADPR